MEGLKTSETLTTGSTNQDKPNEMSRLETTKDVDQSTYFVDKISIPDSEEKVLISFTFISSDRYREGAS